MNKIKEAENIAAQRLRKTFKYPSESDDEATVEAGMDKQGTRILPSLYTYDESAYTYMIYKSYLSTKETITNISTYRPRNPHLHAFHTRHFFHALLHATPSHPASRTDPLLPTTALPHLHSGSKSRSYRKSPRNRIYAVLPPVATTRS